MREDGELNFILSDHLGSNSIVTDDEGNVISQQYYKTWGEIRYEYGTNPSEYTYTGQYSYANDFGLIFYESRWYDPSLGRFNKPDTLIPNTQGIQAWDRYTYSNNNPLKYTDPSGHFIETAFDVAMILVDVADIAQNGLNWANGAALVLDVASVIIPGVPAVGGAILKLTKAANTVDNVIDTVKAVEKVKDTAKIIDNTIESNSTIKNIVGAFCSFRADTKVATIDGEKEIAKIEEDDYVLAWNEETDEIGYYEVTDTFSHIDPVLTELIINGEWIETTPEHPFYTLEEGWLPADELKSGMHVRQADGDYELVWFKWNVQKDQEMYNFTVDTAHTYFVGDGQWLVHNECKKPKLPNLDDLDTIKPGPYADESILARSPKRDFTDTERLQINNIGRTTGCHTCGTKNPGTKYGDFVLDHQPPTKLNFQNITQRLFPHCLSCSQRQGGQVLTALKRILRIE